ncbi:hypothetical protein M2140_000786 [Clostridiales Family XIII bacterium PM5-7]
MEQEKQEQADPGIKGAAKYEMDRCLKNQSKSEVEHRLKGNAPFLLIAVAAIAVIVLLSKLFA